ncbi:MAG TPA: asparagine synthase-related protein [Candidatus Bathyarchaeia archaeon]|nr:asparagine synthase-related protein [Candidatus Bathyarchaeia archaeon]
MGGYSQITNASLKSILTLRYDYTIQSSKLPKLEWRDFFEKHSTNVIEMVENSIINTLKKQIGQQKKVAVALSGGVDSALMLLLLRKTFPKINIVSISVVFANSIDESKQAKLIAEKFSSEHKVLFVENYLRDLPKAISIIKLPFWDLHWYTIVKETKDVAKTLVSGDGGDELFGGYTFRYQKFLSLINHKSSVLEKVQAYLQCHERDWVPNQEKVFGKKIPFSWDEIYSTLYPFFDNPLPPLGQVFLADFNGKLLHNWLPLNSEFHQYFGVMQVTPILTSDLISYATHIKYDLKYSKQDNVGKLVLRNILSKYNSDSVVSATKQGFSVDTTSLWKSHGYNLCNYYLTDARIVKEGWINKDWIVSNLQKDLDIRYINKFLGLLALEIWFRLFITKEIKPDVHLE